ncbi:MAG: GspE/PulE family protein [Pirellulaceae bacterium]|nr:GspE/PulE family protein [Pirellulaceae bacterium]MDP7015773.1 GspE/PulE family protein [Pirellulaceae bacterium]
MNNSSIANDIRRQLQELDSKDEEYALLFVDAVLQAALNQRISDIHFQPAPNSIEVRWRRDGVLRLLGEFPRGEAADVVSRLKVLAQLLTYRCEIPQEGRLDFQRENQVEMRVSTFPTLYGERAVVRLFTSQGEFLHLDQLGLPAAVDSKLRNALLATAGCLLVVGPAGSGKTTTVYACLREVIAASNGERCVVALEDPIEVAVPGATQSQVNEAAGFDLATGLRSILRQDPEVLMVGEIRDRETAEAVISASLTGHLVLSTMHAGDAIGAVTRLLEMGIEPYWVRAGVLSVLSQRLLRRLCRCAVDEAADETAVSGFSGRRAAGCDSCSRTGYDGRFVIGELLEMSRQAVGDAVLGGCGREQMRAAASEMTPLVQEAWAAVASGLTAAAEVRRVFGFSDGKPESAV